MGGYQSYATQAGTRVGLRILLSVVETSDARGNDPKGRSIQEKLKLYGFNNLTKSLSFNIYDVCYAKTARAQRDYIAYIDEQYNSERLTNILTTVAEMIHAKVLHISRQDYDPQGASVTVLIAEGSMVPAGETQLAHLDKSHITVHTYPEYHPEIGRAHV